MFARFFALAVLATAALAQTSTPNATEPGWRLANGKPGEFLVDPGTRIPLTLINSVSTKHSAEGDRVYLETAFPILVKGRIVIPPGSYVAGTVTQVKRPGRVKGRGEIFVRFDSLTLPNGVTRDFRARMGAMDGRASEEFDRAEGKIRSEGNRGGDARSVGEAAGAGATIGAIAGSGAGGHPGLGAGVGAAAGAAAGLIGVLASRGPDAILAKGSTVEMVLDRPVAFEESELDFSGAPRRVSVDTGGGPAPSQKNSGGVIPRRRFPF
jgi:type IV secretion system protein VirB10